MKKLILMVVGITLILSVTGCLFKNGVKFIESAKSIINAVQTKVEDYNMKNEDTMYFIPVNNLDFSDYKTKFKNAYVVVTYHKFLGRWW